MTRKTFLIRFAGFLLIALGASLVYAVTINGLLLFDAIPQQLMETSFGNQMTFRAVIIWCGSLITGFAGIFIKENWGNVLYFSPAYAPSLYAVAYTITQ